jgi:hypothetical protein
VLEATADKGYHDPQDMARALENGIIPNVIQNDGSSVVDITYDYEAADVTAELRTEIKNKVRIAVSDAFASVKGSVSDETKRQVAKLDISELRTEVKEEAKEKILAKFDGDLDDILTEFNQNLANVQKIYTSIAENISKK